MTPNHNNKIKQIERKIIHKKLVKKLLDKEDIIIDTVAATLNVVIAAIPIASALAVHTCTPLLRATTLPL